MNIHVRNNTKQTVVVPDWDENDWRWLVLIEFILSEEKCNKFIADEWLNFEKEIKYNSRFFPKSKLLLVVKNLCAQANFKLPKGQKLYRARLFNEPFLGYYPSDKKKIMNIILKYYPQLKNKKSIEDVYNYLIVKGVNSTKTDLKHELSDFLGKRRHFWGYRTKDSDAPPSQVASYGRANADYISYLYAADDVKTAISEVRPHVDQDVSVATIRLNGDLNLYDFCDFKLNDNIDNMVLLSKI